MILFCLLKENAFLLDRHRFCNGRMSTLNSEHYADFKGHQERNDHCRKKVSTQKAKADISP